MRLRPRDYGPDHARDNRLELVKEILAIKADIPVIMCTGLSYLVDTDTAMAAGTTAFALMPPTKREVTRTVRKAPANGIAASQLSKL